MSNSLGYGAATQNYLPVVLQQLIQNNQIHPNVAQQIQQSYNQWLNSFVSRLPTTTIDDQTFVNYLSQFVLNLASSIVSRMQTPSTMLPGNTLFNNGQNMNMMPGGGGNMNWGSGGGFGSTGNNTIFRDPAVYGREKGNSVKTNNPKGGVVAIPSEPEEVEPIKPPKWVTNPSMLICETERFGRYNVDTFMFPKEDPTTATIGITTIVADKNISLGTFYKQLALYTQFYKTDHPHATVIDHMKIETFAGLNYGDMRKAISVCEAIKTDSSSDLPSRFENFFNKLSLEFTRGVYSLYESVAVSLFNNYLHTRSLQNTHNHQYRVSIHDVEGIMNFDVNRKVSAIEVFSNQPGYDIQYITIIQNILNVLRSITILDDEHDVLEAVYTLKGSYGQKAIDELEYLLRTDGDREAVIEDFLDKNVVIGYKEANMFLHYSQEHTPSIAKFVNNNDPKAYLILEQPTSELEYALSKAMISPIPMTVYDSKGERIGIIHKTASNAPIVISK